MRVVVLSLATVLFSLPAASLGAQPEFPALATIRGENIWLRVNPAEDTEIVTYLQRGDQIRVTADATAADGDEFYPVEVAETGESGWVRALAVDPRSLTPTETLPEVEVDAPPAADQSDGDRSPRQREERATASTATASGVGTSVSESFTLTPGRYRAIATMSVAESSGFIADLHGPNEFTQNIFNELIETPQEWTAETIVNIETDGEYFVEVSNTTAGWQIEFVAA
jgi:hypothetical protein